MSIILKAARFAKEAHEGQTRLKGDPYFNHVARVAGSVAAHPNATEEMVAAAFLHDVAEDTKRTLAEIEAIFGGKVSQYVCELTDVFTSKAYPDLNRAERQRRELDRLTHISHEAKLMKLLDRLDNIRDLPETGSFSLTYAGESDKLATALGAADWDLMYAIQAEVDRIDGTTA